MIQQLTDVPDSMVGFRAIGDVTQHDFENQVIPAVNKLVERTGRLNYLFVLDTPVKNFKIGAWWEDALLGLKELTKWNRAAIVSESTAISLFTALFSKVMPGEFRTYTHNELNKAIDWVSGS